MARLPRPLRVWAARRAIARLKHGRTSRDTRPVPLAAAPARPVPVPRGDVRRTGGTIEQRRTVGRRVAPLPPEATFLVVGASARADGDAASTRRADEAFPATLPDRPVPIRADERARTMPAVPRDAVDPVGGVEGTPRAPARSRNRADPLAGALLLGALACSASIGYVAGEGARPVAGGLDPWRDGEAVIAGEIPSSTGDGPARAARDTSDDASAAGSGGRGLPGIGAAHAGESDLPPADPLWSELGRVRAEILRLRVLFRRLADAAELDDGEFDLDLEPLELPAVRRAAEALDLSIRALDPISEQGARMARIFDERRAAHDRRVGGRVAPGTVRTSGFGLRKAPFGGRRQLHRGVDLAGVPGTPVHALADGVVAYAGVNGGYGNLVEIEHGDGYRTRYAHNERNLVSVGERVAKGDVVATLGSSGRSTGPHVHVEVHLDGAPIDPAAFVR